MDARNKCGHDTMADWSGKAVEDPVERRNWTPEELARRRKRSVVIGLILGAMVVLFFISTLVRLSGGAGT